MEVVLAAVIHPEDVRAGGGREGRARQKYAIDIVATAFQQAIGPERLTVEEHALAEPEFFVAVLIEGGIEALQIDAELGEQSLGDVAVLGGALDRFRSPVGHEPPVTDDEFVAFGMATEVIVVVEQQDASRFSV